RPSPRAPPCVRFSDAPPAADIYTLSLHDALPISVGDEQARDAVVVAHREGVAADGLAGHGPRDARGLREPDHGPVRGERRRDDRDRKSTRLNSSHVKISYAVFCLKKKNT